MSNILTVMKKEFARFFGDRRMIMMVLLPAVLIYVVYSLMGTAMVGMFSPDDDYTPIADAVNMPDSVMPFVKTAGITVRDAQANEVDEIKERITNKETELCIIFPSGFDELVSAYDAQTSAGQAPNIEIYFNSVEANSADVHRRMYEVLDLYEASLANKFDINRDIDNADLATQEDMVAGIISSMLPMLLMMFLFSGCMGLAPESIAGEKERGTLATLLVTPLKRSELAIGKILSLAVLSFLSGLVMAASTIISLPKLMGGGEDILRANIYGASDYMFLAVTILSTILLCVAIISLVSAYARSVKEANTAITPLMFLVMLVGISGMFGDGSRTEPIYYLIPIYNSVQSMSGIFSLDYSAVNIVLACVSNIVFAGLGGFALTKMFNSEKIMFSK